LDIEDANPGKINLRPTAINPEVCVSIPPLVVHRTHRLTFISSAVAAKTALRFCFTVSLSHFVTIGVIELRRT
jgi:hypothetical protein